MHLTTLLASFFIICTYSVDASDLPKDKALSKAQIAAEKTFHELVKKNSSYFLLSGKNVSKYLTDRPRRYNAVVLFVALNPLFDCATCNETLDAFQWASSLYRRQYDLNSTSLLERLFFFVIKYETSKDVFEALQITDVPRLYLIGPKEIDSPKQQLQECEIELDMVVSRKKLLSDISIKASILVCSVI